MRDAGNESGFARVVVVNADGSGERVIKRVFTEERGDLAWSPDGRTILYTRVNRTRGRLTLALMRADGGGEHDLAAADVGFPPGIPTRPPAAWSPDGSRIYYLDGNSGLSVIDRDGTHRRRLVTTKAAGLVRVLDFALSPDGKLIAFTGGDGKRHHIYLIGSDGSQLRKLNDLAWDEQPAWSPDGKQLVFAGLVTLKGGDAASHEQIYVIDATGRNRRNLSNDGTDDLEPAWAPGNG
ncbi:MAG: hypothetical protein ACXVRA_10270 [Gaiellaceae bacterium]